MNTDNIKKVSRNSVLLFASRLVDMVAVVLTNVIIARCLGAASFGQYSFISAYVVSVIMISYCGLDNLTMRDISRHADRARQYLGAIIAARRIMSGLAALFILAGLPFIGLETEFLPALALLTLSEFTNAYVTVQTAVFRAHEKMIYEASITVFWRITSLVFISIGAWLGFGITGLCAVLFVANLSRVIITFHISNTRFFRPDFSQVGLLLKGIVKDALGMGAAILITNWLFRSAQIIIRFMSGSDSVAYFQVSHGIIIQVSVVALSVMLALFPMIAKEARSDGKSMARVAALYEGVAQLLLCLGLFFSAVLLLISRPLILFLFGADFAGAVPIFQVLLVALVPIFIYSLHDFLFVAYNKQRYIILVRGSGLLLVCSLYFLLIPGSGVMGAAFAYVLVAALISLLEPVLLRQRVIHIIQPPFAIYCINLTLAAALSGTFILHYTWTVRLLLFLVILCIVSWQLKGISVIIMSCFSKK